MELVVKNCQGVLCVHLSIWRVTYFCSKIARRSSSLSKIKQTGNVYRILDCLHTCCCVTVDGEFAFLQKLCGNNIPGKLPQGHKRQEQNDCPWKHLEFGEKTDLPL